MLNRAVIKSLGCHLGGRLGLVMDRLLIQMSFLNFSLVASVCGLFMTALDARQLAGRAHQLLLCEATLTSSLHRSLLGLLLLLGHRSHLARSVALVTH